MKTSSGPGSLRQRLTGFAIAPIGAWGLLTASFLTTNLLTVSLLAMGLLALARPAEAEIVYTPANITIGPNTSYNLDLNNRGTTDFTIAASDQFGGTCCYADGCIRYYNTSVEETPASGNGAMGSPPAKLGSGSQIGPSQTFYGVAGFLRAYYKNPSKCEPAGTGKWTTDAIHYLGLAFQINGKTCYGWAKLEVDVNPTAASVTLLGYAYESTPGLAIKAGQTSEDSSAVISGPPNPVSPDLGPPNSEASTATMRYVPF